MPIKSMLIVSDPADKEDLWSFNDVVLNSGFVACQRLHAWHCTLHIPAEIGIHLRTVAFRVHVQRRRS